MRFFRPLYLLGVFVLYALGGGITHYLGHALDWTAYWLGQVWIGILLLGGFFLNESFRPPTGDKSLSVQERSLRRNMLTAALTSLAVLASLTVLIIAQERPAPAVYLLMVLAFLGAFFYSVPPLRLEVSGYGELLLSFLVAYLVPAFAFLFQVGEWHRLLSMAALPLTVLHLAMLLAMQLPGYTIYAADGKTGQRTLLVRMGWQSGMILHNILVLSAFLLLALAAMLGFPWSITWPALLPLPLAVYQILQMRAIAGGAKPNWKALTIGAFALFASMVYLMTFAFWVN
jgi:1,4-dihydroxy-2-naphthoate octaprenyltransferase